MVYEDFHLFWKIGGGAWDIKTERQFYKDLKHEKMER